MNENMDNYELNDDDLELLCGAGLVDDICDWLKRKIKDVINPIK